MLEPDRGIQDRRQGRGPELTGAVPVRQGLALRGFREGGSEGGRRCVVVANEVKRRKVVPRRGEPASSGEARFLLLDPGA